MGADRVFRLLFYGVIFAGIPQITSLWKASSAQFNQNPQSNNPNDLILCLGIGFILSVLRRNAIVACLPISKKFLLAAGWPEESIYTKSKKLGGSVFKLLFYLFTMIFGFYFLKDEPYFPQELLGHGSAEAMWSGERVALPLRMLILIHCGYQVHIFFFELLMALGRKNPLDSPAMLLMHATATIVYFSAYLCNFNRSAAVCVFIHSISDVFVFLCKILQDLSGPSGFPVSLRLSFSLLMISWLYSRVFIFPLRILKTFLLHSSANVSVNSTANSYSLASLHQRHMFPSMPPLPSYGLKGFPWLAMASELIVIAVLHSYWFGVMVSAATSAVRSGVTPDVSVDFASDSPVLVNGAEQSHISEVRRERRRVMRRWSETPGGANQQGTRMSEAMPHQILLDERSSGLFQFEQLGMSAVD
eukprot:GDKJ01049598.1.p1 GENE.GDKJ01049598.1~~GDKJ01049598.1.p1  ORF type:complete len:417 (-),score=62.46 GDKJ01049598.1:1927-3177(-)